MPWQSDHPWVDNGWYWALRGLVPLVVLLVVAGLVVWAVVRLSNRPVVTAAPPSPAPPAARDPALEELRLRYARGEVSREEYLQRLQDLGGPAIPEAPSPPGSGPGSGTE
jgi:putative membrane protein